MIFIIRYTIAAVLCCAFIVPSVTAKDANPPQDDRGIKKSDGQAMKSKTIRGRVTKSEDNSITVEQVNGEETVLMIEPQTRTNHNFHSGDRITAIVTPNGLVMEVKKEGKPAP